MGWARSKKVHSVVAVHTVDAVWARLVAANLENEGRPVQEIVANAGIDPHVLNRKKARILFRQHAKLLDLAAEASGDGCIGLHIAAQIDIRDVGLLAYVGLSSRTLGEAIRN